MVGFINKCSNSDISTMTVIKHALSMVDYTKLVNVAMIIINIACQSGVIYHYLYLQYSYYIIDIGQIPLPPNPIVPDGPFTSGDLKAAIDSHYMFIVANVKVNTLMFRKQFALIILSP